MQSLSPETGKELSTQVLKPRSELWCRPSQSVYDGTMNKDTIQRSRALGSKPERTISAAQDGTLSGTIDYPDQETSGSKITAITYKEPALHFGFYSRSVEDWPNAGQFKASQKTFQT
jgi:hypothetical protein